MQIQELHFGFQHSENLIWIHIFEGRARVCVDCRVQRFSATSGDAGNGASCGVRGFCYPCSACGCFKIETKQRSENLDNPHRRASIQGTHGRALVHIVMV